MKIAYRVLAHNNPEHLQRLITALSSSSSSFFIHIDKKANFDPFLRMKGNNIHLTQERASVLWGDLSQVEAILILLRTALAKRCRFDRFVFLSGAGYPLRSTSSIGQFFENNPDQEFINLVAMPSKATGKALFRLITNKIRPRDRLISRAIRKVLMMAGVLP